MRRNVLALVSLTALALSLSATPAAAGEKAKFEPAGQNAPFDVPACGTTVTITEEVNKVRQRVTETKDGQTVINVRGQLVLRVTAKDGRTARINASGPADITISADGTQSVLQFRGQTVLLPFAPGSIEAAAQKAAGLPDFALTSGLVEIVDVFSAEGDLLREEFTRTPKDVVDVCSLLK